MFSFFKSKAKKISGFFSNISKNIGSKILDVFSKGIDESTISSYEKILYESDLGVETIDFLTTKIKEELKTKKNLSADEIIDFTKENILTILDENPLKESKIDKKPYIIMVVGANGSGKTTSIAKLAKMYMDQGKTVMLAACDTFRAAAVEQLDKWATKLNCDIVKSQKSQDPASVAFDAITSAKAKNIDIVIIDTAGRLHTKTDLMHELEKIKRITNRFDEDKNSPHETILVIDANIGQNAINLATTFNEFTPISSLFLSKIDSTAKGGIIVALKKKLGLNVKYLGVGEDFSDLLEFNTKDFVNAMFLQDTK
jgi:fused signal recognition particle receptor